jgi:hypothetical protein
MQQWVTKKIAEYLGGVEEDDSLTEFIVGNGWMDCMDECIDG